ncbi:sugar ABC transporter permease [Demequina sp. TTPB684]|uniref:multiple monosaccharide ABC transporter permease n=1 Tax=unclassified Demequina TaxID=2620311 RepID=UPI001CF4A2F5|nr:MULTISPECIES: multiple monosaccharide ABC transporter permease [unclassified Demequina]MCB2413280.1 sugar ABC transporter permease [Demequina sp. TTPB684]UPU88740.1 sugar ABC transporter permease [Demequina sp. TMPB413]
MSEASTTNETTKRKPSLNINARDYGLLAALAVIVALFQFWFTDGKLLLPANFNNLISQNAYVVILAIGMVMVIIAGHIDLSVGSLVAMIGAVSALAIMEWDQPVWVAILISLLVGAVVGAWQGFWVAFVRVPAFIVTLAGMLIYRGLAIIFLTGGTIGGLPNSYVSIGGRWVPDWFGTVNDLDVFTMLIGILGAVGYVVSQFVSRAKLNARDLPTESQPVFFGKMILVSAAMLYFAYLLASHNGTPYVLILLGVLVLTYSFVLNRTVFGRHIYAMGGNRFAAMMSGVKTKWVDFFIFVNIGTLAAVAAIVTTSRAGAAQSGAGNFYELDAIASVFIGGAAVQGGVGKISGAVIGALVMGVLNQGLSIMGVDSAWQQVIKGLVLLAAVAFDVMNRRRSGTA